MPHDPKPTCGNCRWWSDYGDGVEGSCVLLLNDPNARAWATVQEYTCAEHERIGEKTDAV